MNQITLPIRLKLWLKTVQLTRKFRFAHHPLCERFDNHVWQLGSIFICQGCALILLGVLIGISFFLLANIHLEPIGWLIIGSFCFILPTTVEFLNIKSRWIKRITRWIIGTGLGCFFWVLITIADLMVLFTAFVTLLASYFLFKKVRAFRSPHGDVCEGCPELARGGICTGLQLEAEAMRKYSDYATELLEGKLRKKVLSLYQQRTTTGEPSNFKNIIDNTIEGE